MSVIREDGRLTPAGAGNRVVICRSPLSRDALSDNHQVLSGTVPVPQPASQLLLGVRDSHGREIGGPPRRSTVGDVAGIVPR